MRMTLGVKCKQASSVDFKSSESLSALKSRLEKLSDWKPTNYFPAKEQERTTLGGKPYFVQRGYLYGFYADLKIDLAIEDHSPDRKTFWYRLSLSYSGERQELYHLKLKELVKYLGGDIVTDLD